MCPQWFLQNFTWNFIPGIFLLKITQLFHKQKVFKRTFLETKCNKKMKDEMNFGSWNLARIHNCVITTSISKVLLKLERVKVGTIDQNLNIDPEQRSEFIQSIGEGFFCHVF